MPLTSRELWWDGSNALNGARYTEWTASILTPWPRRWNRTTGPGIVYRDQTFRLLTISWDRDTLILPAKDKIMNYVWAVLCDHVSVKDLSSEAKNNMKLWIIYIELNFLALHTFLLGVHRCCLLTCASGGVKRLELWSPILNSRMIFSR